MKEGNAPPPLANLKLILPLGEEQLPGALEIRFGDEHVGGPAQVAIVRCGEINEFLRRRDAVFLQHHHEQFRFDDRTGEKEFHGSIRAQWLRAHTHIQP